jgi:hypothetical protein
MLYATDMRPVEGSKKFCQNQIDVLKNSDWGKTKEGMELIAVLEQKLAAGLFIQVDQTALDHPGDSAQYDRGTGMIMITNQGHDLKNAAKAAHEARHAHDFEVTKIFGTYDFTDERRAYDTEAMVLSSLTGSDWKAFRIEDMQIILEYQDRFD